MNRFLSSTICRNFFRIRMVLFLLSSTVNRTRSKHFDKSAEVVLERNHFITTDANSILEEQFDGNLPFRDLKFL